MNASTLCDRQGKPIQLTLYKSDRCSFCRLVMRVVDELDLPLNTRDTNDEPGARKELLDVGGKTQVPCLLINGRPLYESSDIIDFLRTEVRACS